jgi:hypothetical protein
MADVSTSDAFNPELNHLHNPLVAIQFLLGKGARKSHCNIVERSGGGLICEAMEGRFELDP